MADFTYIRDEITIGADLKARIDKAGPDGKPLPADSTIRLVARQIQHDLNFALEMSGYHVVIVAGEYNNNGGRISVNGKGGEVGPSGNRGAEGNASASGVGNRPGGPGSPGRGGGGGTAAATSVRIICELLRGAHLVANGGTGGAGGEGGEGGKGGDGFRIGGTDPEIIEGTNGGNGGPGGNGGAGGPGGQVLVHHVAASAAPVLEAAGGPGGSGGPGGRRGKRGKFGEADGQNGPAGLSGPSGAPGTATNSAISADVYSAMVLAELGPQAAEWIAHRLAVGEYNYRLYDPNVPPSESPLIRGMGEFEAVLRLDPANARAAQFRQQILLDQNVLGLPRELDLIPDFKQYITAFTGFGSLVFGVFNQGINAILHAIDLHHLESLVGLQQQAVEGTIADTQEELRAAVSAQKAADDEVKAAIARVVEVNNQIQAEMAQMENESLSIGDVVGLVSTVAGAVASVAAAIPTAGASLVALVPSVIALGSSVINNAEPILDALFKTQAPDLKNVTEAYKKVGKDVDNVIKGVKELINFVDLVKKLAAGSTEENAKHVALVQRGVELIHAQLLAEQRKAQAAHTVVVVGAKLDRANALLAKAQDVSGRLSLDQRTLREAGLNGIRNAQVHIDSLLGFAFRAQRSLEIYTLKSGSQNLFLDAGYVHPDIEREHAELYLETPKLIDAYSQSWARLLQIQKMADDYEGYFRANNLDADSRRLSFTDSGLLQNFKDTHDLQFTLDLSDLPVNHLEAKVQGVFVALVDATSQSEVISCEVRHAGRHSQKRRAPDDNNKVEVFVQLLQPHTNTHQARTTRLELGGVVFQSGEPFTAPQSLSFWGRGVAGNWGVSIPQSQFELDPPDLTNLSEIQVWIGYQFLRSPLNPVQTTYHSLAGQTVREKDQRRHKYIKREVDQLQEVLQKIATLASSVGIDPLGYSSGNGGATAPILCTPKVLPRHLLVAAAKRAIEINPMNAPLLAQLSDLTPGISLPRLGLTPDQIAVLTEKRWPSEGVHLTVGFLDNPSAELRAQILAHMNAWAKTAEVNFVETNADAQVRVARTSRDGHWSYVGTDILSIPADQPTMNLDSFTETTRESEFIRVIRHETGHTMGFPHEHMRRELVAKIDPDKAIAYFGRTQGWTPDTVRRQVLTPLEESSLLGTNHADTESIMCYQIPGTITKDGEPILGGLDIDPSDYEFAGTIYPKKNGVVISPNQVVFTASQLDELVCLLMDVADRLKSKAPIRTRAAEREKARDARVGSYLQRGAYDQPSATELPQEDPYAKAAHMRAGA